MQFEVLESDGSCQPGPQYTNPRVVVQEHHGAPLLNCSGLVLVRQLIERLGVARAIDAGIRVLRRCFQPAKDAKPRQVVLPGRAWCG